MLMFMLPEENWTKSWDCLKVTTTDTHIVGQVLQFFNNFDQLASTDGAANGATRSASSTSRKLLLRPEKLLLAF
jgi:hypothetical protein